MEVQRRREFGSAVNAQQEHETWESASEGLQEEITKDKTNYFFRPQL